MVGEQAMTVTDADREAAVTYARNFLRWNGYLRDSVRLGQKDSHPLVQAFARHRIAAEQACAKAMQEAVSATPRQRRGA